MQKMKTLVLLLFCVLSICGCGKETETMYLLGIMVDGVFYEKSYEAMPAEVDESAITGYIESYTDTFPDENGATNISKNLIGAPYARVEGGLAILYNLEWYLCEAEISD